MKSHPPQKLKEFLASFVDEHGLSEADELLLDVTPEEVRDLGMFFIRGLCGWMHGLNRVRLIEQQLISQEDQLNEVGAPDVDEEMSDETGEEDSLVN